MNDKIPYGTLIHDILLRKNLGVNEISYFEGMFAHLFSSLKPTTNKFTLWNKWRINKSLSKIIMEGSIKEDKNKSETKA
jgi:hypothetical protein